MSTTASTYAGLVRAWAAHLRNGGALTWSDFLIEEHPPVPGSTAALPTAAQLEVTRLLAATQAEWNTPDFGGLADLVLKTDSPGRGLLDVPLPWPGVDHRFGTPPLEPQNLPREELVRVLAAVLVQLLADEPTGSASERGSSVGERRLWRPSRKRFRLYGAPCTVAGIRGALTGQGVREGSGARAAHLVLAGPLERLMLERWVARVRSGAAMKWQRMWRHAHLNDRLPPAIRIAGIAESLANEFGARNVHVIIARTPQECVNQVTAIMDAKPTGDLSDSTEPKVLGADLLRVVNPLLILAIGEGRRDELVTGLWPNLVAGQAHLELGTPRGQRDWALSAGERMAERLTRGQRNAGYAVHGDPADVIPQERSGILRSVPQGAVVDVGLRAVSRAWVRGVERNS